MKFSIKDGKKSVSDIKIAYIGGGSRGWAWGLMSDLITTEDISGHIDLYDIDYQAAKNNEIIGNKFNDVKEAKTTWTYSAVKTLEEALDGANFVIISILPATFDEMGSDIHTPEKYGIWQPVGDTTGPGGIVRAMRTIPMYEVIAGAIKEHCPKAWVINYTNPMTLCTKALYKVFPEIKAFGCCHEVFGTQKLLGNVVKEYIDPDYEYDRNDIKVNVVGVNHFTWLTEAKFRDRDIFPEYRKFCEKYKESGYTNKEGKSTDQNWANKFFRCEEKVKLDLFDRYGYIAAAGDRHLAEFNEGKWYLSSPERVDDMHFALTTIEYRRWDLAKRLKKRDAILSGEMDPQVELTGEEGVNQIRALLGLGDLITNVNIPNMGQIPNLPLGAVVETNAAFRSDSLIPIFAGNIPMEIYPLIARISGEQEIIYDGIEKRDVNKIFSAFCNDPLVTCSIKDARKLFVEMCENTKDWITMYDMSKLKEVR